MMHDFITSSERVPQPWHKGIFTGAGTYLAIYAGVLTILILATN